MPSQGQPLALWNHPQRDCIYDEAAVCAALLKLLDNPDLTSVQLCRWVRGPDFPTGGVIQGRTGIMQYYGSGRGKLRVKSVIAQEKGKGDLRISTNVKNPDNSRATGTRNGEQLT